MQKMYDKYEEEINIFSLIWYWASHWKSIVAVALIGLIIGCGFAVMTAPESISAETGTTESTELSTEEQIASELQMFNEERMESLQEYVASTGLLEIDPYNLYRGSLTYKIETPQESIGAVYGAIYSYFNNGMLYTELSEATGLYTPTDYANLTGYTVYGVNESKVINTSEGEMTFAITVLGKDYEEASFLLAQMEKSIVSYTEQLKSSYTITENRVVDTAVSKGISTALADYQDTIRKKFTSEKEIRNNYTTAYGDLQQETSVDATTSELSKTTVLMYGAVGLVVAFVLALFVWGLIYLFGDKLYAVDKPENKFGLKPLGSIQDTQKMNVIDRFIARKRGSVYVSLPIEEQRKVVSLNIKNELKKLSSLGTVYIVSSLGEKFAEAEHVKAELEKAGYKVCGCHNVIGRSDVLEQMNPNDAVVIFENKDTSKVSLLEAELTLVKEYVDNVLGIVLVGGKK